MPRISEEKKEANSKKILESAQLLFAEKGYMSVTVDDICKKSNISKGSFYNYFPSKESIFLEIAKEKKSISDILKPDTEMENNDLKLILMKFWDLIFSDVTEADLLDYRLHLEFWLESSDNLDLREVLKDKSKESLRFFKNLIQEKLDLKIKENVLNTWAIFFWAQSEGLMLYFTAHNQLPSDIEITEIRNIVQNFITYMMEYK